MRPSLFRSSTRRNRICFPAYCATCSSGSHGTATSPKQFPLTAIMLGAQAVHDPAPSAPPEARWLESGWLPQARRKRNHGQAKRRRDGTDRGGDRAEGRRRKLIGVLVRSQNMPDNVMRVWATTCTNRSRGSIQIGRAAVAWKLQVLMVLVGAALRHFRPSISLS